MKKILENTLQWTPVVVVVLVGLFAVVRMQAVQVQVTKSLETKLDKAVYETQKDAVTRELNLIHKTLERFERKFDAAIRDKN